MHAYTVGALTSLAIAVVIDLWITRTRVIATRRFWITALIVSIFQIPVDGRLTDLHAPIVEYSTKHFSGVRVFFSSPLEDFIYGLALLVLTIALWEHWSRVRPDPDA